MRRGARLVRKIKTKATGSAKRPASNVVAKLRKPRPLRRVVKLK